MSEPTRTPARITRAAVALVALVAAVVSYAHMQHLALEAGEGWRSHLLPLSVDGFLVTAAMSMLHARRHGHEPTWLARASLTLGISASLAANIAAADPTLAGRLVAAWPPLALALTTELLVQQGRHHPTTGEPEQTQSEPVEQISAAEASSAQTPVRLPQRATPAGTTAQSARAGSADTPNTARTDGAPAQRAAREVFEQARAAGRAEAVSGAELARAAGVHPGTARKWLAAWRAEPAQTNAADETSPRVRERGKEVAA